LQEKLYNQRENVKVLTAGNSRGNMSRGQYIPHIETKNRNKKIYITVLINLKEARIKEY
jgi:hypothetical protein